MANVMATNLDHYSANLTRWRRAQLLDRLILEHRLAQARPSLVINPLTLQAYGDSELGVCDQLTGVDDKSNS